MRALKIIIAANTLIEILGMPEDLQIWAAETTQAGVVQLLCSSEQFREVQQEDVIPVVRPYFEAEFIKHGEDEGSDIVGYEMKVPPGFLEGEF